MQRIRALHSRWKVMRNFLETIALGLHMSGTRRVYFGAEPAQAKSRIDKSGVSGTIKKEKLQQMYARPITK